MEFRVPGLGEGVLEAELVEWRVRPGDLVRPGQALAEVMTDKATFELPASFAGVIESLCVEPGQVIEVGQTILRLAPVTDETLSTGPDALSEEPVARPANNPEKPSRRRETRRAAGTDDGNGAAGRIKATPAVRRMARALGIDLRGARGTGRDGRVLIDDLAALIRRHQDQRAEPVSSRKMTRSHLGRPGERWKLQGLRRAIADHMVLSKKTIPHYSYIDECDVTELTALRDELKRPYYTRGIKLTSLPFFVRAVVFALQQVPLVNASLDEQAGEIVLHDQYHIGIATSTAKGLVVPVVRHADRYDLGSLAGEMERLIRAAQAGTLPRHELNGSTFTISSVGNIGGLISTPIIHHPEVGILAIGRTVTRPDFGPAGQVVPARIVHLSFSFDHRVVDGAVGALFGNAVRERLENPQSLIS
jgi:2-oxoisovalerate dehydrogenase E2 component (dihydrolipoyl transacylase)